MKIQRKWRRTWQKRLLPAAAAAGLLVTTMTMPAYANPTGGQITAGAGSITQSGSTMTVIQSTGKLSVNWQSFNIGANETVNFVQPGAGSIALNRVVGNNASTIYGRLNANGQVFLVNPNGVLFARGAQVNVGGLVASTQNLSDSNFQAGNYRFSGNGGSVINQGAITAANGGYVVLLGSQVSNQGIIVAQQGTVALGAGNAATLDFNGDGLLNMAVSQPVVQALVENKNIIQADGGLVILTARAADALAGTVLNNSGVIQARSIHHVNGAIIFDGGSSGTVSVSGTLDASGNEAVQTGGTVKVLGSNIAVDSATIDASGEQGGGTVLIGGNLRGQGPEYNAVTTTIGQNAVIHADAVSNGNGGKVVVWANDTTVVNGTITAKGGSVSGNGGSVETSGHTLKVSDRIDTTAARGATGNWLLDPDDFTIGGTGGDIDGFSLQTALESSNITIQTTSNGSSLNDSSDPPIIGSISGANGTGRGDIYVNEPVTWLSTNTLTLSASNNINLNAVITASTGGLNLTANTSGLGNGTTSGIINAPAMINVRTFTLNDGVWRQIGSTLPMFNAADFRINGGTFIRALGGDGTSASPYRISDVYGLQGIGSSGMLDKSYVLVNHIDASGTIFWNSGAGFIPIGSGDPDSMIQHGSAYYPFTGSFNGQGCMITGLYMNNSEIPDVGLFGSSSGTIQNVGLVNATVSSDFHFGYVGVLAGCNGGSIMNSYSTGVVRDSNHWAIGGLVGCNDGTIENSYNTGQVTGSGNVGGLVGRNFGMINTSYSTGQVTGGNNVGGLVGKNDGGVTISYWDVDTSHTTTGIGSGTDQGATGLSSAGTSGFASAFAAGSYSGWNMAVTGGSNAVWRIYDGHTYPLLRSSLMPLTVRATDIAKDYDGEPCNGSLDVTYDTGGTFLDAAPTGLSGNLSVSYTGDMNPGIYRSIPTGLYSGQQGYDITYENGRLWIKPRPITVQADDQIRNYGDANPTVGMVHIVAGNLVNGDRIGVMASVSSDAPPHSVGNHSLMPSNVQFASGNASNYNIFYVSGTLTVLPPPQYPLSPVPPPSPESDRMVMNGSSDITNGSTPGLPGGGKPITISGDGINLGPTRSPLSQLPPILRADIATGNITQIKQAISILAGGDPFRAQRLYRQIDQAMPSLLATNPHFVWAWANFRGANYTGPALPPELLAMFGPYNH